MERVETFDYLTPEDYAIARGNGIKYHVAYERFYKYGWDKQRTITEPLKKEILWDKYKEKALANDVSYQRFRARIRDGKTPEEAIAMGRLAGKDKTRLPAEVYERAEANGIKKGTMKHRIYRLGWDIERAITEPVQRTNAKRA